MEGETRQHWYPLMGRQANEKENLGDILVIMSFVVNISIIEVVLKRKSKKNLVIKEFLLI
jgi:hypothetical protein